MSQKPIQQTWITAPQLRARWAGMSPATFARRLKEKAIPAPEYPFGPKTAYWRMTTIEAFERRTAEELEAA